MSNRATVQQLIMDSASDELLSELNYHTEIDREWAYDLADALDDAYTFAEENDERRLLKEIRLILIKAGFYIEAPEKTDVGRDTRFTLNKVKYEPCSHWSGWIEE